MLNCFGGDAKDIVTCFECYYAIVKHYNEAFSFCIDGIFHEFGYNIGFGHTSFVEKDFTPYNI